MMKKLWPWMATFVVLLILTMPAGRTSQQAYRLGNRTVPGPLPPNPDASRPLLETWMDVTYGVAGGEALKLDFARPIACVGQTLPLAIYVHGGGWHAGDKAGAFELKESVVLFQLGYAVASLNYRLSPDDQFPAQINDCKLAVRFFRKYAQQFGINAAQIGLWGGSAGGHLVALMAVADEADGLEGTGCEGYSSRPQAVVAHYGVYDLTYMFRTDEEGIQTMLDLIGCLPAECPLKARQASPITYVTADDPPILVMCGDKDWRAPFEQSASFAQSLHQAGTACALIKVLNAGHVYVPDPITAQISPTWNEIAIMNAAHIGRYTEPALLGDLNMDGQVNVKDWQELVWHLDQQGVGPNAAPAPGSWNPLADIHSDGVIDQQDMDAFLKIWKSH
ncbi:MAG: alpha/beta hydrolase fold domain-containing protein [Candidatus Aminicenantales bacterium]